MQSHNGKRSLGPLLSRLKVPLSVATGYGQPPATVYDWTLAPTTINATNFKLPQEAEARLLIEKFCNKVTKSIYSNENDPVGLTSDAERSILMRILVQDLEDLEAKIQCNGNPTCEQLIPDSRIVY